jgi:hypothetical protein
MHGKTAREYRLEPRGGCNSHQAPRRIALFPLALLFVLTSLVPANLGIADTSPQQPAADQVLSYPTGETTSAEPVSVQPGIAPDYARPKTGSFDTVLASDSTRVGDTPVSVALREGEGGQVLIEVLGEEEAAARGGQLLGFRILPQDDAAARSRVEVEIDFAAIEEAFGEDYASRLELYYVPDCFVPGTEGRTPDCQPRLMEAANDYASKTLTATVDVVQGAAQTDELSRSQAGGGGFFLGSGSGGPFGNYGASGLGGAATWSVGLQSGNFGWSKDLTVPPTVAGPQPQVAVTYSSQSVDGMTGQSNSQPSHVGIGFDLSTQAFITASTSCAPACTEVAGSLSLLGQAGELVVDTSSGGINRYRLEIDPGWIIEKVSNYYQVTTTDGTKYLFGNNILDAPRFIA